MTIETFNPTHIETNHEPIANEPEFNLRELYALRHGQLQGIGWNYYHHSDDLPRNFSSITLEENTLGYDPTIMEYALTDNWGSSFNDVRSALRGIESQLAYWRGMGISLVDKIEVAYFLRTRIAALGVTPDNGIEIGTSINDQEQMFDIIKVGSLLMEVNPIYPLDYPEKEKYPDNIDLSKHAVINIRRQVDDNDDLNYDGRNPKIARPNFISEIKKAVRQLKHIGFKTLSCYPTDQRRRRIYERMGLQPLDIRESKPGQLFAHINDLKI
jgi:hypothetical protein